MEIEPTLTFPVIRGLQARREYYVAMWTLRMLRQISIFDEDELPPELRAQRTLNRARIPEISDYVLENPDDYVFSAITVSIDSQVTFEPLPGQDKLGHQRRPTSPRRHHRGPEPAPRAGARNHRCRLLPGHWAGALPADVRRPQPLRHPPKPLSGSAL